MHFINKITQKNFDKLSYPQFEIIFGIRNPPLIHTLNIVNIYVEKAVVNF